MSDREERWIYCGKLPPLPLFSTGFDPYANWPHPFDFKYLGINGVFRAVREGGNGKIIFTICDSDNPDCVIRIVDASEASAEDKQSEAICDTCGHIGYIIDGYFIRNEKIS